MGILNNLFNLESKKNKKPVMELTMKESLAKLAIDLIGASKNTSLIPLKYNDISKEYTRLTELGLGNSMNARFLKGKIIDIDTYNKNILKAYELLDYVKTMNRLLGDSVILVSRDSFYKLCHKYKLSIGFLKDFTGIIPDANLRELSNIKDKLDSCSGHTKLNINENTVKVQKIYNYSNESNSSIRKYFDYNFNIIPYGIYTSNMSNIEEFKNEEWAKKVILDIHSIPREDMFIACPKSNLQEKVTIVSHIVDPIIFQYCPFGVLIYTMWGEEAEDKVFEEYKKLRTIE